MHCELITSDSPSTAAPNALVDDHNPRPVRLQSEENLRSRIAPSIFPGPKRSISKSEEETRDRPSAAYRLFLNCAEGSSSLYYRRCVRLAIQ